MDFLISSEIKKLVSQLTLEEKAYLCSGADMFSSQAIERLGIPAIHFADGPHGLRKQSGRQDFMGQNQSETATCFPAACATGSSFDTELLVEMGHMLGKAAQAADVQVLLGPGINIKRNPLCGRNFEYFSEDPYLSGCLGAAYVKGVQAEGVGTSLKHFFANNQETRRRTQSSELDERTMREVYLPAFEQVIREAQPWTLMSSYNKVHGRYVNESPNWCRDLLRNAFGFEGMMVSDWAAVHDRVAAIKAGCALTMPADKANDHLLVQAVQSGELDEALLDEACEQIVALALRANAEKKADAVYDFDAAHSLARKIAAESMVLLKNEDHILPLDSSKKIAIIGKFAAEPRYQGAGSSRVNAYKVPTLAEVTAHLPNITYSEGFDFSDMADEEKQTAAVLAAAEADIAIIVAGLPDIMESEGFDRWVMKLPRCQNTLIERICAVQPNTIVVLQNGGAVEMPWANQPKAILEAYLGGEAVSEAIWDVLTGAVAPSGHLAETFPLRLEDNPSYLTWPGEGDHVPYSEGVFVGYRYYSSKEMPVLFPFGHGLTYTDFSYSDLKLSRNTFAAGEELTASVTVTNIGQRSGKALVQLYVTPERKSQIKRPVCELRGFQKVSLEPGERRIVTFTLDKRAFAHWDMGAHTWRVAGGEYAVRIQTSAETVVLEQKVSVADEYIPSGRKYDIMTPICDVKCHPAGKAFMERIDPMLQAVLKRMGPSESVQMPYAALMPKTVGMDSEPLQTLMRMFPQIPGAEWEELLCNLNGREFT